MRAFVASSVPRGTLLTELSDLPRESGPMGVTSGGRRFEVSRETELPACVAALRSPCVVYRADESGQPSITVTA